MRMSLFLGAASPCWCFVNYRSRDNKVHEGHRMGHSPSLKSPAPAQPGALAAFCVSPVSFPLCTGRGCRPILKRILRFPSQHIKEQLPRPDSGQDLWWDSLGCGDSSCPHVFLHSVLPPMLISLGQRQGGDNIPRFAAVSAFLYLYPMFSCFYSFLDAATNTARSKILLQNLSLTSEEILLAWRCVSQESGISLDRSNISAEVNQAFP